MIKSRSFKHGHANFIIEKVFAMIVATFRKYGSHVSQLTVSCGITSLGKMSTWTVHLSTQGKYRHPAIIFVPCMAAIGKVTKASYPCWGNTV